MRPVGGFDRPVVQWIFVALGLLLIVIAGVEAIGLRRARARIESLRAADLEARVQREEIERRLMREQSTRESLTLELGRARTGAAGPAAQPTLTLTPLTSRGARPPEPTVAQPAPAEVIELRLVLPRVGRGLQTPPGKYSMAIRTWSAGETVWSRSGLVASILDGKPIVTAFITGDVFTPGAYEVLLTSAGATTPEVATYEVSVHAAANR